MIKKFCTFFLFLIFTLFSHAATRGIGVVFPNFESSKNFEKLIDDELHINFDSSGITPKILEKAYLDKTSLKSSVDAMLRNPKIDGIFVIGYNENIYVPKTSKFIAYPFGIIPFEKKLPDNIKYIYSEPDVVENVKKLRQLKEIKTLAVVMSRQNKNYDKQLTAQLKKIGVTPLFITDNQPLEKIKSVFDRSDAVYLISNEKEIFAISQAADDMKLPTFLVSLNPEASKYALMGYSFSYEINKRIRTAAFDFFNHIIGDERDPVSNLGYLNGDLFFNIEISNKIGVYPDILFIQGMSLIKEPGKTAKMKLSFKDAIQMGLSNNPTLKASLKNIEAKDYSYLAKSVERLPQAGANMNYTKQDKNTVGTLSAPENLVTGTIQASQVIYDDSLNATVYSQKMLYENSKLEYNQAVLDYTFAIASTYLRILQSRAQLDIQRSNYDLVNEFLRISKIKYETGATGIQDVYRMESTLSDVTSSLASITANLRNQEIALNTLLNAPVDLRYEYQAIDELASEFFIGEEFLNKFLFNEEKDKLLFGYLSAVAINNSNQLKALENNIKILERQNTSLTRSRFIPKISAFGQYNKYDIIESWGKNASSSYNTTPENGWRAGLSAELPIFTSGEIYLNQKSLDAQIDSLNYQKDNLQNSITQDVNTLATTLLSDYVQTNTTGQAAEAAKKSLEIYTNLYAAGSINITEILDSKNAAYSAELANVISRYNFLISAVNLEKTLGRYNIFASEEEKASDIKKLEKVVGK